MANAMKLQRTFPSDAEGLNAIIPFMERSLFGYLDSAKSIHQIVLAVEEITSNIVKYAYLGAARGGIEISIEITKKGWLEIEIVDSGGYFDPTAFTIDEEPKVMDQIEIGKRGILLTRQVMDEILYKRKEHKNHLIMRKKLGSL